MKKKSKIKTNKQEELQSLSLCILSIRKIIEAHITEPIEEDKELHSSYYLTEVDKLSELLKTPTGLSTVKNPKKLIESLTSNLILNKGKTDFAKKQLNNADDCTSAAWGDIQKNRDYKNVRPTTGFDKNDPLKIFLEEFLTKKQKLNKENLKEKKTLPQDKSTFNLGITEAVQWNKVVLKVKEGKKDLEIFYDGNLIKTASYIELGFSANKKNHKPNKSWYLLIALSALQKTDIQQATPEQIKFMLKETSRNEISKDNVYKTKERLSNVLKFIFNTIEKPFVDRIEYYEPIFKILPEPVLRNEEIWSARLNNDESQEPLYFKDDIDGNDNEEDLLSEENLDKEN